MALEAIYLILKNAVPVTSLVALRIYPGVLPEGETLPAISIFDIDEQPTGTKDAASAVDTFTIQVSIHVDAGLGYEQIKPIANAVKAALNRVTGDVNGTLITGMSLASASPVYESDSNTFSRALRFTVMIDP